MIRSVWLTLAVLSAFANCAQAAIQGDFGVTSKAVSKIRLVIDAGIQIVNVDDIELEVSSNAENVEAMEYLCIHGNTGGQYSLLVEGTEGEGKPFTLIDGEGRKIPFELYFLPDIDRDLGERIVAGERSRAYPVRSTRAFCSENDNVAIRIVFPAQELRDARAAEYVGHITMTISSE